MVERQAVVITVMACNGGVHVSLERREDEVKDENNGFHILLLHNACFYLCCKPVKPWDLP
jgi:hypothetical protein